MDSQAEADRTPADKALRPGPLSEAVEEGGARSYVDREMLHVRAVEFVAKAGQSSQLQDSIDRPVLKFLARQTGFAGAMVLTPHKEPRRILVLSFWRTERGCRENEWELAKEVRRHVEPLIDAVSRVQTYRADLSQPLVTGHLTDAAQPC